MPILENSVQYFLASTFFLPALELSDYQSHRCLDLCQLIKKTLILVLPLFLNSIRRLFPVIIFASTRLTI